MSDTPPIRSVIGLPPDATVRAFEARDRLQPTVHWSEMYDADHARAFTVAKVARLDLLGEIQSSLADVVANGGTFEQWQRGLVPYLQAQGWWGKVADKSLTGTDAEVTIDSRRLRTIYDTNLRVSRAAGQWTRIQALKASRPFLRYTAVLDSRTRPAHRAWHGTILPVDHEWWDTHYPPCGWFCRCTVRQLSQRELTAKGWSVTAMPPSGPPQTFLPAGSTTPVRVPAGISPGFGYNPGKASMAAVADKATRSIEATAGTDLAAARSTVADLVRSDALPKALAQPGVRFPVMVVPPAIAGDGPPVATIGSEVGGPLLDRTGPTDERPGLPELRMLPELGAAPDRAFRADDGTVTVVRGELAADLAARDGKLSVIGLRWLTAEALAALAKALGDLLG